MKTANSLPRFPPEPAEQPLNDGGCVLWKLSAQLISDGSDEC